MRDVVVEVLRDIVFYALRQVLRDRGHDVSGMRRGYDVVYYQVGEDYHTVRLSNEDGFYVLHDTTQEYGGSIINDFHYKLHEDEQQIKDFMNCLDYVVTELMFKKGE